MTRANAQDMDRFIVMQRCDSFSNSSIIDVHVGGGCVVVVIVMIRDGGGGVAVGIGFGKGSEHLQSTIRLTGCYQ